MTTDNMLLQEFMQKVQRARNELGQAEGSLRERKKRLEELEAELRNVGINSEVELNEKIAELEVELNRLIKEAEDAVIKDS